MRLFGCQDAWRRGDSLRPFRVLCHLGIRPSSFLGKAPKRADVPAECVSGPRGHIERGKEAFQVRSADLRNNAGLGSLIRTSPGQAARAL
jgi:hypothetical protein